MSKLIAMRNRIKAIKTIKKITHAMRLISMSNQTRLKKQHEALTTYVNSLGGLFEILQSATPEWSHPIFTPSDNGKTLHIIIGSQKGLCGSFNTNILKTIENETKSNIDLITIGKKVATPLAQKFSSHTIYSENAINTRNMHEVANTIIKLILNAKKPYTKVVMHSNVFKSFFIQEATVSTILPIKKSSNTSGATAEYIWEQEPHVILEALAIQYLQATIKYYMFQSLLSEHAARFVSMDNSTRNANSLLETTTLTYNKLRQTKITTEITELSSNF